MTEHQNEVVQLRDLIVPTTVTPLLFAQSIIISHVPGSSSPMRAEPNSLLFYRSRWGDLWPRTVGCYEVMAIPFRMLDMLG